MSQSLQIALESAPYSVETAQLLESHAAYQLANKAYDFNSNKALMKNYQVNRALATPQMVANVLILSMMRLPLPDFLSLSYLIPYHITNEATISKVLQCADLLERGKFREFWETFVPSHTVFAEAAGFVDYIRLFIVSNLRDTFRNMPKSFFQQQLGLDENSVPAFCEANKFIEKVRLFKTRSSTANLKLQLHQYNLLCFTIFVD